MCLPTWEPHCWCGLLGVLILFHFYFSNSDLFTSLYFLHFHFPFQVAKRVFAHLRAPLCWCGLLGGFPTSLSKAAFWAKYDGAVKIPPETTQDFRRVLFQKILTMMINSASTTLWQTLNIWWRLGLFYSDGDSGSDIVSWQLVSFPAIWSFSFIMGPLDWSSREHRNIVQLCITWQHCYWSLDLCYCWQFLAIWEPEIMKIMMWYYTQSVTQGTGLQLFVFIVSHILWKGWKSIKVNSVPISALCFW